MPSKTFNPDFSILDDPLAQKILAASFLLRAFLSAWVGPGFDEAYYYLFSRHLSAGYFDHPPLVAFVAGLGNWLTGLQTPLALRFGAILVFTFTLIGLYELALELKGRSAARLALILPHATPFFLVGAGAFVIPDNALTAAWIWALVLIARLGNGRIRPTAGFLLLGVLFGLALLAKYHAVLLPASLVVASLYDRRLRRFWSDWRLYAAFLAALIVFLPCILWNAANDWISFREQFGKGVQTVFRLRFDLLGQAVGGQLGYLTPWMAVALWIGAFRFTAREKSARWLLAFFLIPVGFFTLLGLTRGILPHWTMPGYLAAIVLAACGLTLAPGEAAIKNNDSSAFDSSDMKEEPRPNQQSPENSRQKIPLPKLPWIKIAVGVNIVLIALVLLQARTGLLPVAEKADPTLDPVGWEPALQELKARKLLQEGDVLFTHRWFTGGEIAWADRLQHPVVVLNEKPHMFAWWAPPNEYLGRSGVFLTQERYGLTPADIKTILLNRFAEVDSLDLKPVQRGRRTMRMLAWRVEKLENPPKLQYGEMTNAPDDVILK